MAAATNECTSVAGHFDGHAEALKRYMQHHRMHDAACSGPHWKPLDATIGQLLAPYRLGSHQGNSKQNNDVICTHFDCHFDGHSNAAVLYHAHCLMKEVKGFHKSH
jgi:hypothetical protein